jgi:hypothetical protein
MDSIAVQVQDWGTAWASLVKANAEAARLALTNGEP